MDEHMKLNSQEEEEKEEKRKKEEEEEKGRGRKCRYVFVFFEVRSQICYLCPEFTSGQHLPARHTFSVSPMGMSHSSKYVLKE